MGRQKMRDQVQIRFFVAGYSPACSMSGQFRSLRLEAQNGSSRRSSCSSLRVVAMYLCVCCREKLVVPVSLFFVVSEVLVVHIHIRVVTTPSRLVQRFINFDSGIVVTLHPVK